MENKIKAVRYHDMSCGHRVAGHESKCAFLHGHNYRVHFFVRASDIDNPVDSLGRVLDFSVINQLLCQWLEQNWDHKFLAWDQDRVMQAVHGCLYIHRNLEPVAESDRVCQSIVWVPFNPTAENMAEYLLNTIGPKQLQGTGVRLVKVVVEETRKCSVEVET